MIKGRLIVDKVNYYAFLLFLMVSPINLRLQILCFDFWLLTHIVTLIVNGFNLTPLKRCWPFLVLTSLFILYSISLTYTENITYGIKQINTKLGLFIIPLICITRLNPYINIKKTLFFICVGFLLSIIFILGKSVVDIVNYSEFRIVYNGSVLKFLQSEVNSTNHRLYWGMYGLFAFISAIYLYVQSEIDKNKLLLVIAFLTIIGFFLVIIESRIIWVQLIIVVVLMIKFISNKKLKKKVIPGIAIIFLIISYLAVPRFVQFFHLHDTATENLQFSEPRLFIWTTSWQAIKESWLVGYGVGDAKDILTEKFIENKNYFAADQKFIAHNQFLQTWLEVGVFGVIFILLYFVIGIVQIGKIKRNFFIICLYFILFCSLLVESILNRFQGVVLFALVPFIVYLLINDIEIVPKEENEKRLDIKWIHIGNTIIGIIITSILLLFLLKPKVDFRKPETFLTKPYKEFIFSTTDSLVIPNETKGLMYNNTIIKEYLSTKNEFYDVIYTTDNFLSDSLYASIYCKVSKDFNGLVSLYIGSSATGYSVTSYNFNNKDAFKWQKLKNKKKLGGGEENVILFIKPTNLKFTGEIYFIYPEIIEK